MTHVYHIPTPIQCTDREHLTDPVPRPVPQQVLTGHTGSVLCLQYDDKVIISGSSDATVRVWDVGSGELVNTLIHHCEAVLHLRFAHGMMVTCSKVRGETVLYLMLSPGWCEGR